VDLRPGPPSAGGSTWALAGLSAVEVAEEGPAMGEGEVRFVNACAVGSFAGTLRTSDVCACGGEAAPAVDDEVWGEERCTAGGIFNLIFPFVKRCGSLGAYCGTANGAGRSDINFANNS
jgi:hypothetical protein